MSIKIKIQPVAYPETDREERARRTDALAKELRQIEGVETAEVLEPIQKLGGIQNAPDPAIIVAIIGTSGLVISTVLKELFKLLAAKRATRDHRETVITVNNNYFIIKDNSEPASVEAEILNELKRVRLSPEQRKRLCAILEVLSKRKGERENDLEKVYQKSCGSVARHVFVFDWEILLDKGFVVGTLTNDNDKTIIGTGRITPRGEEALKHPSLSEEDNGG
jgi:hypothetical protein